jgi:hemerythrin-like domain-containing protein
MNPHDIAQQTLVENGMLQHLEEALRATMAWEVHGPDLSRKLSTLRFIAGSFQRHLERMFTLEEFDGYMDLVLKTSPNLGKHVFALKNEHGQLRNGTRQIIHRLERVGPTDQAGFDKICDDFQTLLQKLDHHTQKEVELFQEAFHEGGGEG